VTSLVRHMTLTLTMVAVGFACTFMSVLAVVAYLYASLPVDSNGSRIGSVGLGATPLIIAALIGLLGAFVFGPALSKRW
jgi:hypothetical protein